MLVRNVLFVKTILDKVLFARSEGEGTRRYKREQEPLDRAMRAIALEHRLTEIKLDLVAHRPTVAPARFLFHQFSIANLLFRYAHCFVELNREELGHAVVAHGDAIEDPSAAHGLAVVGDHDEL